MNAKEYERIKQECVRILKEHPGWKVVATNQRCITMKSGGLNVNLYVLKVTEKPGSKNYVEVASTTSGHGWPFWMIWMEDQFSKAGSD